VSVPAPGQRRQRLSVRDFRDKFRDKARTILKDFGVPRVK
jgi:hypothetical protein